MRPIPDYAGGAVCRVPPLLPRRSKGTLDEDAERVGCHLESPIANSKSGYPQPKDEVVCHRRYQLPVFSCQLCALMDSGNKRTLGDACATQQIPKEDK